ncbi:MAG: hypothetical protein BA865_09305 [Desulfobacterales bacterium S5133MH4]|nr:MAG: hypothetical protein BA865_09305 [Desulfobacterales bacterium S5133MH4]
MIGKHRYKLAIFVVMVVFIPTLLAAGKYDSGSSNTSSAAVPGETPYYYYGDPATCAGRGMGMMCHANKFQQWQTDQHARAWTGDFMVAQYYDLAKHDADVDHNVEEVKIGCVGCHSPSAYMALGEELLHTAPPRPVGTENAWNMLPGSKTEADRGVFCDFCHTISAVGDPPVNFNFTSAATDAVDPKRGAGMKMNGGTGYHETIYSPLHDDPKICGTCHDEIDPFGQQVKGTYTEWLNSPSYPDTRCQDCHQRHGGKGHGGGMMGRYSMNFKGGFSPWIEGVATVNLNAPTSASPGEKLDFTITVTNEKAGHEFPSGSEEERQLWLHVMAVDGEGTSWHIPVTADPNLDNPSDPNHTYWVTTNEVIAWPSPNPGIGEAISRDGLPEGDRIYHSIFISPDYTGSKITYAQYYAAEVFSNRLKPLEPRVEQYSWMVPHGAVGSVTIQAVLNYRRMPDSMADFLGIDRRPVIQVNATNTVVNLR